MAWVSFGIAASRDDADASQNTQAPRKGHPHQGSRDAFFVTSSSISLSLP
jgi:hypothetical protein